MGCCLNEGLRAPLPPQIIFFLSTGLVYLIHWNPLEKRGRLDGVTSSGKKWRNALW